MEGRASRPVHRAASEQLVVSRVFFDSNLFIYLVEHPGPLGLKVKGLLDRMSIRNDKLIASTMSLGEVLVKPTEESNLELISKYQGMFYSSWIDVVSFDEAAALQFATIRHDRALKGPDAIQLACAAAANCDLFVTNDERLSQKVIPGIQFITSLDRVPI